MINSTILLAIALAIAMFSVVSWIMGRIFTIVKYAVFAGVLWVGAALSTGSMPNLPVAPMTIMSWAEGLSNPLKGRDWTDLATTVQEMLGLQPDAAGQAADSPPKRSPADDRRARHIQRDMQTEFDFR
ncbi:hypothetical protein [Bosea beijingensis]|uniref:hypothetical protein n=1 Tax=Bosea beijingensis TaxID=3068632 RepID=UPI002741BE04|nr:hypothetical protein [Bosea sp. REN20]